MIEGFHGVQYRAPVGRARETAEIYRMVWRRERVEYNGRHYTLPLGESDSGTGLGKPLKLINHPVRQRIPMLLAAIGPKNVELATELFEEWQPVLFHAERWDKAFGEALRNGYAKRAPELGNLGITVDTTVLIADDDELQRAALAGVKAHAALYIGGMGARGKNFYNDLAVRYGYADAAKEIQDLYLDGRKREAAEAVPEDLAGGLSLVGLAGLVKERLAVFEEVGAATIYVAHAAPGHADQVEQIRMLKDFVS